MIQRCYRLSRLFIFTVMLGIAIDLKMRHYGSWMPVVPMQIDFWTGRDTPHAILADRSSRAIEHDYVNPFNESAHLSVVAARTVSAYKDPACLALGRGYTVTAEKDVPLGKGSAKLLVLRREQTRRIMISWSQTPLGKVSPEAPPVSYSGPVQVFQSMQFVLKSLLSRYPTCLIQVSIELPQNDALSREQAKRNVANIAEKICQSIH